MNGLLAVVTVEAGTVKVYQSSHPEMLQQEVDRAKREDRPYIVLMSQDENTTV